MTGNNVDVWDVGVMQTSEAAETQIYIEYRDYVADFDLADTAWAECRSRGAGELADRHNRWGYLLLILHPDLKVVGYRLALAGGSFSA